MQDGSVEHSDGDCGDGNTTFPDAVVLLHAVGGASGHHYGGDARAH